MERTWWEDHKIGVLEVFRAGTHLFGLPFKQASQWDSGVELP